MGIASVMSTDPDDETPCFECDCDLCMGCNRPHEDERELGESGA